MRNRGFVMLILAAFVAICHAVEITRQAAIQEPLSYHSFLDTPFIDGDKFHNTVISGSTEISFQDINEKNAAIRKNLETLVHEPFFRIFKLNLYKSCPFWEQEGFCLYRSCAVDTINDWTELPEIWQPEELGKVQSTPQINEKNKKNLQGYLEEGNECIDEIENNNYCHLDGADEDCVYVDLVENPERFTGYGGEQSFQIWKAIYEENCFHNPNSIGANALQQGEDVEQCLEKQIFYRLISGMHSSISTHLTNEYLNLKTKEYEPNLMQFMFKVGNFPERFENMYLNYILVVKSLIKLYKSNYLDKISLCSPEFAEKELELKQELKELVEPFLSLNKKGDEVLFNEKELFQDAHAADLKNDFKMRFRNVSSIMDCVHCDRCRVWGKLQTIGYGTALKVLFELDEDNALQENFSLEKIELIALINTFDRLSKSILSVLNFEKIFLENYRKEEDGTLSANGDADASSSEEQLFTSDLASEIEKDDFRITPSSDAERKQKTKNRLKDFTKPEPTTPDPKSKKQGQSVKESFYQELNNVYEALIFIWNSYFSLPKHVFDYTSVKLNHYWNKFLGLQSPLELNEQSYLQTLFDNSRKTTSS